MVYHMPNRSRGSVFLCPENGTRDKFSSQKVRKTLVGQGENMV